MVLMREINPKWRTVSDALDGAFVRQVYAI